MQLTDFPHVAGIHCSSSSIADVLRYDGEPIPEPMVFGLGSGLGFVYSDDPRYSPVHRFNGRSLDLEAKFYALFGAGLAWAGEWKPEAIEEALARGRPVLAQTDIAYLPYYEPVHFPLHGIVIAGFDGATALVADTISPDLQAVPVERLKAALVGEGSPFMRPYRMAGAPRIELRIDAERVARAIEIAAGEMLAPSVEGTGIPAMHRLAANRVAWRDSADWSWSARFAYQSIEKRGTGGGGFRALYADFLDEARALWDGIERVNAVERMRAAAAQWSEMAGDLKRAFVENERAWVESAGEKLERIARFEAALLGDLREAPTRKGHLER